MNDRMPLTVAQSLAAIAADLVASDRSGSTSEAVTRTLLDWFAVAVAGSAEHLPRSLTRALATGGPARFVGHGAAVPLTNATTAALVNGTAAHTLELDDIYAPGLVHPGAPVVAAALAVGETTHASGGRFADAIVAGIEVAGRAAQALGPTHYRRWHTTGTAGALGAAAATAHLLDLGEEGTAHAICLATTMAAGLQQTFRGDSAGKPLHAGNAAQAGVTAALAASCGVTGALDALEGESGLAAATGAEADWAICFDRASFVPCIERLTVKPYPCCGHTFAAVGAALDLHHRDLSGAIRPEEVEEIAVTTYQAAIDVAGNPDPSTVAGAKFSLAYTAAAALTDGRLNQQSFTLDRITDADRRALAQKVTLAVGDDFQYAFPARRGAAVTVVVRNGKHLTRVVPDRPGSPENPLSTATHTAKFTDLVTPVLGADRTARLRDQILDLGSITSIGDLYTQPTQQDQRRESI